VTQRGDLVTVAMPGDYGKPRPAVVVQSNLFEAFPSVVVCPLTSTIRADADTYRVTIEPTAANGLREPSQISIDKIAAVAAMRIGQRIGRADDVVMDQVTRALAVFLDIR
jgi:mRNA interferase MazF